MAIFEAVHWLAKDVPQGEAGLFYFSGHGLGYDKGLILAPTDFQNIIAEDSGVTLRRLIEILKSQGGAGRFLIILDCCRDGERTSFVDDLAPNICILYACGPGGVAQEGQHGGLLTRSLASCLEAIALDARRDTICTVRQVDKELARLVLGWRTVNHELHGCWADNITLSAKLGETGLPLAVTSPTCLLEFRTASSEEWVDLNQKIKGELLRWYHLTPSSASGKALLDERIETENSERILRLRLPEDGLHWRSGELLEAILMLNVVEPKVIVVWPRCLRQPTFQGLASRIGGRCVPVERLNGPTEHILSWMNQFDGVAYQGNAHITTVKSDVLISTQAFFYCQSLGGELDSIRKLLPSLIAVYDIFRYAPA